jgi:hypothetical protein
MRRLRVGTDGRVIRPLYWLEAAKHPRSPAVQAFLALVSNDGA